MGRDLRPDRGCGFEIRHIGQCEANRVPQFVAKLAVAHHPLDVEVDVPPLDGVCEKAETQGVSAALGDALREVGRLAFLGFLDLWGGVGWGEWRDEYGLCVNIWHNATNAM